MTGPIYQGTPDFVRTAPYSDQVLISDVNTTDSVGRAYGAFYVGNVRALYLFCIANTNFTSVQLTWQTTQSGGTLIESNIIDIGSPQSLRKSFRPYGPWLVVTVFAPTGLTTNYQLTLTTMSDLSVPRFSVNSTVGASIIGAGIGAGASVVTVANVAHIGEAYWEGFSTAATWLLNVEVVNNAGGITTVSRSANDAGRFSKRIFIPTGRVQVRAQNTSGAAALYDAILTYRPDVNG